MFYTVVNTPLVLVESKCNIIFLINSIYRSNRPEVFCKKDVLRNFAKFTGKHGFQSLFFAGLRPATLLKERFWHRCFPVNFVKFLRTPFLKEHLWWLLLDLESSVLDFQFRETTDISVSYYKTILEQNKQHAPDKKCK